MTPTDALHHAWTITDREYRRQEERRGRRFAYESLDPARTALIVVDMVPFFLQDNPYTRGIVPVINTLAHELRAAGGHVTWVVPAVAEVPSKWAIDFYGERIAAAFAGSGGQGTPADRITPQLHRDPADPVFEKKGPSAFFPGRCDLPAELEKRGVDTVLITGTVTNVCCEATARDAASVGLRVVMVADGCSTVDDRAHNATLNTVYRSFGDVRPAEQVISILARPGSAAPAP